MKKILPILIAIVMVCSAMPALATFWDNNPAYQYNVYPTPNPADITTQANVVGGNSGSVTDGGGSGIDPPLVKVAWQYDMNINLDGQDSALSCYLHDADPNMPRLQVAPVLGGDVTVGYYAVVTGTTTPSPITTDDMYISTYVDVWHPDGMYKYQLQLKIVGYDTALGYDETQELAAWDHVTTCHSDLIRKQAAWANTDPNTVITDVREELDQQKAYLYYGEQQLSYCQPGGDYLVGTVAMRANTYSATLYDTFWYIPTSAVDIDFNNVVYDHVMVNHFQQAIGGDTLMTTPDAPTVRNVGNTPIYLMISQDDTQFGYQTPGVQWNVQYKARMGGNGIWTDYYWPEQTPVRIPGTLPMCTQDKLDFGILVTKAFAGNTYHGTMQLSAMIDMTGFWPDTVNLIPGHTGLWATQPPIPTPTYPLPQQQPTPFTWAWLDT